MKPKILTMEQLLTVVEGETLLLDSWGKDEVTITISKGVNYENGEEFISAKVLRGEKSND